MKKQSMLACCILSLAGLPLACSKTQESHCIGEPACSGEWQVFQGALGEGQPCTTPAGDLHVRYENKTSDELVAIWSKLIPETLGLRPRDPWGTSREFRQAWFQSQDGRKVLNVGIVQSGSTNIRTVRLTWE